MQQASPVRTRFEGANPILNVADMRRSVQYYVQVLGFTNANWGDDDFTCVTRDDAGIYCLAAVKANPERGHGSALKTSALCMKSTRPRVQKFFTLPRTTRGRTR